jgi:hypothetical protein
MKDLLKLFFLFLFLFQLVAGTSAASKEIPFTLDDRDRILHSEQGIKSVRSEMNARFDAMDKRFDQLFNFLWAIVGIFTTMMVSVFGFAFWDRKLSLAPLKREDQRIVSVLIELAKTQPKLTEILRNAGLL